MIGVAWKWVEKIMGIIWKRKITIDRILRKEVGEIGSIFFNEIINSFHENQILTYYAKFKAI